MARRRTDRKPSDYTRCARCRRLLLKSEATQFDGFPYGPECIKMAISASSVPITLVDNSDKD